MNYSLIANSGIQFFSKEIEIDLNDGFKQVFYEWFDEEQVEQRLYVCSSATFFSLDGQLKQR